MTTSTNTELAKLFQQLNEQHFDGFLDLPDLKWNSRLRSSAGRFIPGRSEQKRGKNKGSLTARLAAMAGISRAGTHSVAAQRPAQIEVATYLAQEGESARHIRDTLAHEMIHYWLWVRGRPYGHTPEFYEKMEQVGTTRYNPVPRTRPYKYSYRCPNCAENFQARRKLGPLACAKCCKSHSGGRYDSRFQLKLEEKA